MKTASSCSELWCTGQGDADHTGINHRAVTGDGASITVGLRPPAPAARLWAQSSPTAAFAAFGSDGYTHIYLLAKGVGTQLTTGAHNDETPEWSSDGKRLVFQRADSTRAAVYVMNAEGTGLTRL